MGLHDEIYKVVAELRLIAAAGLHFASSVYERERYQRVRQICAQLIAAVEQSSPADVVARLSGDIFDQRISPISTCDAVVMRNGRMLLIKRHDNRLWALPGGLVEVNQTLANTTLRELREETGLGGQIVALLGIFDSHIWESQDKAHLHHAIFLVHAPEGEPHPTPEALDVGFFGEHDLPSLAPGHQRRVPFVFRLVRGEVPIPYLDPPSGAD
jgi:ADP-ribose pyrophosphatase YjhB (NUDIX family)